MTDYNRTTEAQENFKGKRKPKNPIKFNIQLNSEQKEAKKTILNNPITLLKGAAGSGKTLLACNVGLDLLFRKEIEKIVITRPTVSKEELGFLPGDIKEKMDPWLSPIYSNLYMLYNREKVDKEISEERIEVAPFAFMRGRTFVNSLVIVDECQNLTHSQTELIMGRLGKNSLMIFCGDLTQADINRKQSGISFFKTLESKVKGVNVVALKANHRHEIVLPVLKTYDEYRDM